MNIYSPPAADVTTTRERQVSARARLLLLPAFALGGVGTSAAAFFLCQLIPWASGSVNLRIASLLGIASLAAVAGAAPWWKWLASVYGRHAFLAAALVGSIPATLRLLHVQHMPLAWFSKAAMAIDTAGVVVAFALGAAFAASPLGANNSSKPTPLRGAA